MYGLINKKQYELKSKTHKRVWLNKRIILKASYQGIRDLSNRCVHVRIVECDFVFSIFTNVLKKAEKVSRNKTPNSEVFSIEFLVCKEFVDFVIFERLFLGCMLSNPSVEINVPGATEFVLTNGTGFRVSADLLTQHKKQ